MTDKIDLRPKVLEIVKLNGPVIPRDIVKEVGGDTFIIGAVLAKLREEGQIKVSSTKIGGSPTYYCHGQEFKLQQLDKYLNEKDRKAFDLIKAKKVLQDKAETPLMRVALRQIKDFAKPLEVNAKGQREIFWKWYLLPNTEAEPIIKKMLNIPQKEAPVPKTEEKTVQEPEKPQETLKKADDTGDFLESIKGYFEKNNIKIIEEKSIKKKKEYELLVSVPSSVGNSRYYVRAKDKKKCSEGDLSTAYVKAQAKKYPLLFLSTGELSKKAQAMIDEGELENVTYKRI